MPKIAVVEDERAMSEKLREMLREIPDVDVMQAFSTQEGRQLLARESFDLLVLDIELDPGTPSPKGGLDLLIEYGATQTIIVVTGMPEPSLHEISIKLKAFEFVRKPIIPVDFLNKVRHALAFRTSETSRAAGSQNVWPDGLTVDPSCPPNVLWKGRPVSLTMIELTMVHTLAKFAGKTVTYEVLCAALKSGNSSRVVNQHMSGVRRKFSEVDSQFDRIGTDPMKGYIWRSNGV